jgi:tetratricopeptide (TPR) repeat protein
VSRLAQLQQMLADEPDDLFLNYALGMEYQKSGDANAALAQFAAMNQRFPDHVAAWHQRGRLLADVGDTPAACEVLKQGISVAERVGDSHAAGEMQGLLELIAAA